MNRLITTIFCLSLLIAFPAQAQQREYKSGLNYTTLGARPKPAPVPKPQAHPAENAIESEETPVTELEDKAKESPDPATRIWNKYKELATGTAGEKEQAAKTENNKPEAPEKPDVPLKPKTKLTKQSAQDPKPNNGFGAILENWKNTKDTRRDMRSMSFKTPDLPTKPSVEKPQTP